jgi:hypothetical protein
VGERRHHAGRLADDAGERPHALLLQVGDQPRAPKPPTSSS